MWHSHFGCDHKGIIGVPPPFLRPPLDGRSELSESPTVPIGEAFQVGVDRIPFMAVHPQEFAHPFGQSGARGRFCLVLRLAWSWINFLQTLPKLSVWLYLATYCSTKSTSPFVSSQYTWTHINTTQLLVRRLCESHAQSLKTVWIYSLLFSFLLDSIRSRKSLAISLLQMATLALSVPRCFLTQPCRTQHFLSSVAWIVDGWFESVSFCPFLFGTFCCHNIVTIC